MNTVVFKISRFSCNSFHLSSKLFSQHNLNKTINMPRSLEHTTALKKQRLKVKEKSQKYVPGTVTLHVLGSGAYGAPRSLYMFTDQARYLFNCGEGTQRLAHEHKMKLSKLEHIFVTHPTWENMGGLPGVALTIQDVGVPEITLHGPEGIDEIFIATRNFIVLRELAVKMADSKTTNCFQDNVMSVTYVPIYKKQTAQDLQSFDDEYKISLSPRADSASESSDEDVDYYAYAIGRKELSPDKRLKRKRRSSSDSESKRRCLDHPPGSLSMAYICRLNNRPGTLLLEECVNHGVPPGPLLGRLKAGEDVTLDDGRVVLSKDVREPDDPGAVFIVVECPTEDFLDSLLEEQTFLAHQQGSQSDVDVASLVVHFTPSSIMNNPRYKKWMSRFSPSTHHLLLNDSNSCMGSIAVHRIQHKLNILDPDIFPLLKDEVGTINDLCSPLRKEFSLRESFTVSMHHLRPYKVYGSSIKLTLNPNEYVGETMVVTGFTEELESYRREVAKLQQTEGQFQEYPKVVFLGTGSCIPNKTRNTSGILVHLSSSECILLDCGEATFGQLVRLYGPDESRNLFNKLVAVYVSHLHADHHIGLVGLLKARVNTLGDQAKTLYLLAPKQIMRWLSMYNGHFERVLKNVEVLPLADMDFMDYILANDVRQRLHDDLKMSSVHSCTVRHCPNSFGVAFKHKDGWKLTYSGDTMPSSNLVQLGQGSDLLIHEATMEDELEAEAQVKMHSTTSQAIKVGRDMNAKFTLLTHFSQRYAKLPRLNDSFTNDVGIAFDNMQVRLSDLRKLPLMYPALKLMFADQYEELEMKAIKRQLRQELMNSA